MSKVLKNLIGKEVRRRRVEAGWSQEILAARCQVEGWDLSRATLSKIEAGLRRVNDAEVFLVAKILKCELADLFKGVKRDAAVDLARHREGS